jgi:mannosylglycoprotein endo-beta-mannosidase
LKWYQRFKAQFILEGDSNTRYFHGIANGRHRRKHIQSLVQDEGLIEGHDQLKSYITNYYKELFGPAEESSFSMDAILTAPYSEDEVNKAVFQMEHNKAPVQMVSQLSFTGLFWTLLKRTCCKCLVFYTLDSWNFFV